MITNGFFTLLAVLMSCSEKKDVKKQNPAEKMQQFVTSISKYSKELRPGFVIIPQNACELAHIKGETKYGMDEAYLKSIDAIAVEELYYNGDYAPDEFRINILKKAKKFTSILVAEYISDSLKVADAVAKNEKEGFVCFPREKDNYHYKAIPKNVTNINSADVTKMDQVKNYLYLINNSEFDDKKQFINAIKKTNFDMVTIDLFFGDDLFTAAEIEQMKTKANGGKRLVICYMNIGAAENWRYYWKADWELGSPSFIKKKYQDYDDEYWVKYWDQDWQDLIYGNDNSYAKKIIDAGFDGAFLDNAEAYYFLYKDK